MARLQHSKPPAWHPEDLKHVIPQCPAVYFVLNDPLTHEQFVEVLSGLMARVPAAVDTDAIEAHWTTLEARRAGARRWDSVSPREQLNLAPGREAYLEYLTTRLTPSSLALRSRHVVPVVDCVRYTVDYFNPANELGLPYRSSGEPVLALLMEIAVEGLHLGRDPLPPSFYDILRDLYRLLSPEHLCATYSLYSILCAYDDGRANPAIRPWTFLHNIQLLTNPAIQIDSETEFILNPRDRSPDGRFRLARVEEYEPGRVLIQIHPEGFGRLMLTHDIVVARALGTHAMIELVEGRVW